MEIKSILNEFKNAFEKKIDKDYHIKIQLEITDVQNNIWQIDINNGNIIIYNEIIIEPEEIFVLSKDTIEKLYNNKIAPLTAFAYEPDETGEMFALIEVKHKTEDKKIYPDQYIPDDYFNLIKRQHIFHNFFSKDYPTKIVVNKENGIKLHNVNGIGLHSNFIKDNRILHAYFSIKKEEILTEPAFEFSIFVINGKGIIVIDEKEYAIDARNYYNYSHRKPKNNIYIKNTNEELLEILYLSNT